MRQENNLGSAEAPGATIVDVWLDTLGALAFLAAVAVMWAVLP